jgi:hypothetical protein
MAKIKMTITQDVDCFEVNGKHYKFKGKVAQFISPEHGKVTVEEAYQLPELLAELVKNKSDLIEEVNVAKEEEQPNPKTPEK